MKDRMTAKPKNDKQELDEKFIKISREIELEKHQLHTKSRIARTFVSAYVVTIFASAATLFALLSKDNSFVADQSVLALTPAILGAGVAFVVGYYFKSTSKDKIEDLSTKKEVSDELADAQGSSMTAYLDSLVNLNLANLAVYYKQVERHTNRSFYAGLVAAIVGFLLIGVGVIMAFTAKDNYVSTVLVSASGLLSEFIASIFFSLYNKTVLQMKKYHDDLVRGQNVLLAFRTLENIKSDDNRDKTIHMMAEALVKSEPSKAAKDDL